MHDLGDTIRRVLTLPECTGVRQEFLIDYLAGDCAESAIHAARGFVIGDFDEDETGDADLAISYAVLACLADDMEMSNMREWASGAVDERLTMLAVNPERPTIRVHGTSDFDFDNHVVDHGSALW